MTYVCVNFTDATNLNLTNLALKAGIKEVNQDLHATLVYSSTPLEVQLATVPQSYNMKPIGYRYIGMVGSKWRTLAMVVESKQFQHRFEYYLTKGYKPRFPKFLQHISLAYEPPEGLDLSKLDLPTWHIEVASETVKKIKL
jgi:hypothetical protein